MLEHIADGLGHIALRAHRGGDDGVDALANAIIGSDDTGAAQRQVFPCPGMPAVVIGEGGKACRQGASIAGGAQAHIGFVEHALGGRRGDGGDKALGQAGEILVGRQRPLAVRAFRRSLSAS
jgi:hypothetical protein